MQHLWISPQMLQTRNLRPWLRPLDATLTRNRGWAYSPLNQKTGIASPRLYSLLPEGPLLEAAKSLLLILSALFPIVNPLGGSPVFFSLTADYSHETRKALALRIARNSFFLLVGSYFIGTHVLAFFGISIPVVQVGGGLVVTSTGWAMLKQKDDEERKEVRSNAQPQDPYREAFYPFTLPLTVGPGSISVAITLGANAHHNGWDPWTALTALIGS